MSLVEVRLSPEAIEFLQIVVETEALFFPSPSGNTLHKIPVESNTLGSIKIALAEAYDAHTRAELLETAIPWNYQ